MKARSINRNSGIIRRLLRSQSGNIGIMTAALIVPLVGMVGSGVDFSRYFLIKSRLQLACDAGALAGRKAMEGGTFNSQAKGKANEFFDVNFAANSYGSTNLNNNYTEDDGIVTGRASVKVDTAVLQLLDIDSFDINVACSSKLNIPDTDIMFVLDTTGSMLTNDSGGTRMKGLQGAVTSFVSKLQSAKSKGTTVRYGFVPYSSNVNVGHLLRKDWMTGKVAIESRKAELLGYDTPEQQSTGSQKISGSVDYSSNSGLSSCSDSNTVKETVTEGPPQVTTQPDGTVVTVRTIQRKITGQEVKCTRSGFLWWVTYKKEVWNYNNVVYQEVITETKRPRYTWRYDTVNYDLPALLGSGGNGMANPGQTSVDLPVGNMSGGRATNASVSWNGCITELVNKTREITNFSSMPNDVPDIDINHIPGASADTRWGMALPRLAYLRALYNNYGLRGYLSTSPITTDDNYIYASEYPDYSYAACPTPARSLSEMSVSQVTQYVNSLRAEGGTYHDIGLVWGGRLISPNGIYAGTNDVTSAGGAITRHVIFMTDGDTAPNSYILSAYGFESLKPVRGSFSKLESQINGRTQLICNQIKGMGATLWVVAFGPGITDFNTKKNLEACASEGSYFEATNNADLAKKFEQIADRVAELRLVE